MRNFQKIFSERLRELRKDESQSSFSKKLGLKQNTYSNYETGTREPSLQFVAEVASQFGVSADWLLGLESSRGATHVTASGHAVAANHSTVTTPPPELPRLLGIIESQQRVIDRLSAALEK